MGLVIRQRGFVITKSLTVKDPYVSCVETAFMGGKTNFSYPEIEYVLMSPGGVLSLQAGNKVFTIQTNPNSFKHRQVIDSLMFNLRRSASITGRAYAGG